MNFLSSDFNSIIAEQFEFVKSLSGRAEKTANVLRHKASGKKIIYFNLKADVSVFRFLMGISHPNLPRVYSVEPSGDRCEIYEEFIDGITVGDVLQTGHYTESGMKKVVQGVCSALEVLHKNKIIHRDIKPENVIIDTRGNVKLIDFDAARVYDPSKSVDTTFAGTAGFAAPEQFAISQTDQRSDIFSLGIMMNIMLTGDHPSSSPYGGKYGKIIEKCIQTDPNKRYNNVSELAELL